MNYINSIIKIIEIPQTNIKDVEIFFKVEILDIRALNKTKIILARISKDLAYILENYFRSNDFVLIEGYLTRINLGINRKLTMLHICEMKFLF